MVLFRRASASYSASELLLVHLHGFHHQIQGNLTRSSIVILPVESRARSGPVNLHTPLSRGVSSAVRP